MPRQTDPSLFRYACGSSIVAVIIAGCSSPDPTTVAGVIEAAAAAIEAGDRMALYPLIDSRARAALSSIVKDRARASRLIAQDYPEAERSAALASLGDAAQVGEPVDLFARRCEEPCLREIAAQLGAPEQQVQEGVELVVRTTRGQTTRLFRAKDGRLGIVWRTAELAEERTRANRELLQVTDNAKVYRRRRALEAP